MLREAKGSAHKIQQPLPQKIKRIIENHIRVVVERKVPMSVYTHVFMPNTRRSTQFPPPPHREQKKIRKKWMSKEKASEETGWGLVVCCGVVGQATK